ncbi:MAG: glycosyltransferase family 9 protein [Desulfobacterales bacterium]|nr:glycosyltransferase family 9 protein [Desulfobacterales bacterium]
MGYINSLITKLCTPPTLYPIPTTPLNNILKKSKFKVLRRFIRRFMNVAIKGQLKLELEYIKPEHKKILWVSLNMPQIGDSLMDLSSRVLLKDRKVDLFSKENVCSLFRYDDFFNRLISNEKELVDKRYDLIIIDIFKKKSIAFKSKYLKNNQYVSMGRYYDEGEFNRTLFSFCRMYTLLNIPVSYEEVTENANLMLSLPEKTFDSVDAIEECNKSFITITTGGVHSFRIYNKWKEIVELIIKKYPKINIVLVGSRNGVESALEISNLYPVTDLTDKLTIFETAEVLRRSKLMICADGGLLHLTNSMGTPVIGLFAGGVFPEMRMSGLKNSKGLYSENNVSEISPEEIINEFKKTISNLM